MGNYAGQIRLLNNVNSAIVCFMSNCHRHPPMKATASPFVAVASHILHLEPWEVQAGQKRQSLEGIAFLGGSMDAKCLT